MKYVIMVGLLKKFGQKTHIYPTWCKFAAGFFTQRTIRIHNNKQPEKTRAIVIIAHFVQQRSLNGRPCKTPQKPTDSPPPSNLRRKRTLFWKHHLMTEFLNWFHHWLWFCASALENFQSRNWCNIFICILHFATSPHHSSANLGQFILFPQILPQSLSNYSTKAASK